MIKGFRKFLLRGNVIDLAVAFVIGVAFTAVVQAFVNGLINPIIKLVFGGGFDAGRIYLGDRSNENYIDVSLLVNAIITFLATAAVVYVVFVVPMNKVKQVQARRAGEPSETEESELDVLRQIRDGLTAQPPHA
jgi:large conductance mechanosensitive channel